MSRTASKELSRQASKEVSRQGSKEVSRQSSKEMGRQGSKSIPGSPELPSRRGTSKRRTSGLADMMTKSRFDEENPTTWLVNALSGHPDQRSEAQLSETLRWWQKHLPASGAELAPELRAPDHVWLEVFRRGRICACEAGRRLQEEGDEVRSYTIVLMGRCKLRCSKPAPVRGPASTIHLDSGPTEEELVASGALDSDGVIPLGEVNRGESLGMFPGDQRALYEVTCSERTTVLMLGREDYEAVLKPFQREVHAEAVDYLRRHALCPEASMKNLEWLARVMKHKKIPRGRTIMRAGDPHRNLWFLRQGSCSVFMGSDAVTDIMDQRTKEDDLEAEEAEEAESEDEDESDDPTRMAKMKAASCGGAEAQNRAAADDKRNKVIAKYARGSMRSSLDGSLTQESARKQGADKTAASLNEPGAMFGEEVLLFDPRDLVNAKCSYTVKADQDCTFYVADFTTWRQLSNFVGPDGIAQVVHEQLQRRSKMVCRSQVVSRRLDRRKRRIMRFEHNKDDQQQLRLPGSTGSPGPTVCEDVNEYLQLVFDHRKNPRDLKNLPTLSALEGTKLYPGCPTNGPAVNKMLKVAGDLAEMSSKKYCENLRSLRQAPCRRKMAPSINPMGESVPAEASTYCEKSQEFLRALPPSSPTIGDLSRISSQPSGIFQQTELDVEVTLLQSSSVPLLPRVPGSGLADTSHADRNISTAPAASSGRGLDLEDTFCSPVRPSTSGSLRANGGIGAQELQRIQQKRSPAAERQTKLMKAFSRVGAKKSVLVLTDKADIQKSIMRSLLAAGIDLCFVKTSMATWQRLQDSKESFHALIWDLTKSEVAVNRLLKNIRAHDRYSRLPIVVLSSDKEISEMVRLACSFVVFHPIAPAMLREALLWCFDRKVLTRLAGKQETVDSCDFLVAPGSSIDAWPATTDRGESRTPPPRSALKMATSRQAEAEAFMVCDA